MRRPVLGLLLVGALGLSGLATTATRPAVAAGPCRSGFVSLTFDDGPDREVTPRLVGILRDHAVPATFFMVGRRVASAPGAARLVDRSGLLVANHSYHHTDMRRQTRVQVRQTLRATQAALRRAGTRPTRLMRPPYGALDAVARLGIADAGLTPVLWTVDPRDWEDRSTRAIADSILQQLRPDGRNVVIQHDGVGNSPRSVAAVPIVIREARRRGYCFTALDERGDPGFPTPAAAVAAGPADEGRAVRVTVSLDRPTARATSVRLRSVDATARAGDDFTGTDLRVLLPAGRTRTVVRIPTLADGLDEPRESLRLRISDPSGLTVAHAETIGTIVDGDPPPRVRVDDLTVAEPPTDRTNAQVTISLARPSGRTVVIRLGTVARTADRLDYVDRSWRVVLAPGETTALIDVGILADELDEPDETFAVAVLGGRNIRDEAVEGTITITAPTARARRR